MIRPVAAWLRLPALVCAGAALCLAAGCVSHPQAVQQVKQGFSQGGTPSTKPFDGGVDGKDAILMRMERGRLNQLLGNYEASAADYEAAVEKIRRQEEKAVVSATAIGAQVGASLVNDLAIPYAGEAYERIMLFQLDAFNRLAMGNLDGVGVDVRNMAQQLERELERYEKEVKKVEAAEDDAVVQAMQSDDFKTAMSRAEGLASQVLNSFQNAYAYAFAGAYYEGRRDWGNALIAYQRALRLQPKNEALRYCVWAMLKRGGKELPAPLANQAPRLAGQAPKDGEGEVFFFFEWGYNIEKQAFSLPLILPKVGVLSVALPVYNVGDEMMGVAEIKDAAGHPLAVAATACDFRALAAKALQERMPGILTRQVIRATVKGTANYAASDENAWLGLLVMLFNVATEQADLRSWLLLPRYAQVARFALPEGTHELVVTFGAQQATQTVEVRSGRLTILHGMGVPGVMRTSSTLF